MPLTFRKQPSGGRGEYELVGEADGISAVNLMDHGFIWETPFGPKETDVALSHQGGKRRLRLTASGIHVQRQAAALALLPKSIRDEDKVSDGRPIVLEKRYILDVGVAVVSVDQGMATVRPTLFTARSGPANDVDHKVDLDASDRFARLEAVWGNLESLPTSVASAVDAHRKRLVSDAVIGTAAENAVSAVIRSLIEYDSQSYIPGSDPLPALELLAGLERSIELPAPPEAPADSPEIRQRLESEWRLAKSRGSSGDQFKRDVQVAYRFTCVFCGFRALDIPGLARSGVDAAHILPWAQYDLDHVRNGLQLCKQDHWAFDKHVLLLRYLDGVYSVELNPRFAAAITDQETLEALNRAVGPIPDYRLPEQSKRPDPEYIARLYEGIEDY